MIRMLIRSKLTVKIVALLTSNSKCEENEGKLTTEDGWAGTRSGE